MTFSPAFIDTTKKWFDATVQGLNFSDTNGSLAAINGWVNTATNGTIPTILDNITPDEVMFADQRDLLQRRMAVEVRSEADVRAAILRR